jgi:hypothetical protein
MMDLIPTIVDGAIVCNLKNDCSAKQLECPDCANLAIKFHNWLIQTQVEYVVFDLQDEKDICPGFLQEILQLKKRIRVPFLFSGVMLQARKYLDDFNYGRTFPIFLTPEDAIRALRMQFPGVTEIPFKTSLSINVSLSRTMEERLATL